MRQFRMLLAVAAASVALGSAQASLTPFQQYTGNVDVSTDGFGSTNQSGVISASVPVGSTVIAAYLYTSTFNNTSMVGIGATLNGTNVGAFTSLGALQLIPGFFLTGGRADVTNIVKPIIDGGAGGLYNFNITETNSRQDGEALVVVYSNPALLGTRTVGILDGFSAIAGDSATINFANPLDTDDPAFFAEMRLGIGFSCCGQRSNVTVNGTLITENAGNNDDGAAASNGSLITMGGFDDPFSPMLPNYANDHERYNLTPLVDDGDSSISIRTLNPSNDDNIFLAVFNVLGEANICTERCTVPEPMSLALVGIALAGLGLQRPRVRRR